MDFISFKQEQNLEPIKKKKIKNIHYRKFLDENTIELLTVDEFKILLEAVQHKNTASARAILIILYYTGCRPIEALKLKQKNITREKNIVTILMPASKRGLTRPIPINIRLAPYLKEVYEYSQGFMPDALLFYDFLGQGGRGYEREYINKKGIKKVRYEHTDKLRYYIKKWAEALPRGTIPPYFFRHNRFSHMSSHDATTEEIQFIKGSKTLASVQPYVHMSTNKARKITKKIF